MSRPTSSSHSQHEDQPIKPGSIIDGRFRVEEIIGEGGMGLVVRAEHLKLGSQVALKFLLPAALKERVVVERFTREARAAARLTSDHVARITDVGTLPNGAPFMVMEYLIGETLGAVLRKRGALPIGEACHYMIQVCEGLSEAHAAGIVHRDLKPANLFLASKPNGKTVLKILDFGISKVEEGINVDPELTTASTLLGTPNYMAPEQLVSAKTVDARADIWSCGVCLHRMLSGSVPFDADSIIQLSVKLMNEEPPDLATLRSDIPSGLAGVVRRCLEREPGQRWQSTNDLARALEPYATFESARLPPLTENIQSETVQQPFAPRMGGGKGSSRPPPPPPAGESDTHELVALPPKASPQPTQQRPSYVPAIPFPLPPSPGPHAFGSSPPTPLAGPMEDIPPPPESGRSPGRMGLGILGGVLAAAAILVIAFVTKSKLTGAAAPPAGPPPLPPVSVSTPAAPSEILSVPPPIATPSSPPSAALTTTTATTTTTTPTPHAPKPKLSPPPKKATPSKPPSNNTSPIPDER